MRTRRKLLTTGLAGLAGCVAGFPGDDSHDRGCLDARGVDARLGFTGDVMLGRSVNEQWVGEEPTAVWGSTLSRLQSLDGLVVNLECCVSTGGERWPDKVYYFRADPTFAVPALREAGVSFASLANNHILDFGETGLSDTQTHLDEAGIAHAGAGPDQKAAIEPAVFEAGGLTVAAFALTDQAEEFAAAANTPGTAFGTLHVANAATRALVDDALTRAQRHDPDLVVASLHWGPNWETVPNPIHEEFARWLVDQGVDVVHGHSAHVLQGVEVYQGRPIIYDAGDFVDDYVSYVDREGVHNKRSALFEVVVADGQLSELRVLPIRITDERATVADGDAAAWVRETLTERSEPYDTTVEERDRELSIPLGDC
ncbi:CapA family protein [Halovenus salina]|uniref:CapA family protein n=1 Tax=Halovenus salina TaxID=1510225 RepID=UPI002260D709|nr:CapA family protein [Halovenus salina]